MTTSLVSAMAAFSPSLPLAVAYSGGADSTALLLACAEKWPGQVEAVHIHHGLQVAADDFERHCEAFCARLQVPLAVQRVNAAHTPGQSPEDAARIARYQAFRALDKAERASSAIKTIALKNIALAQHADDQVETILLALSRGAGLAGLAAMPSCWERDGICYHRPLLAVSAADIRAWLAARGVAFIEDPTNVDERFTRNRIRARLTPVLQDVFPQFRETFTRTATHAAQAQELLAEVAAQDLATTVEGMAGAGPVIKRLQALSRARQANVLRHWLKTRLKVVPSAAQLDELLDQVAACTTRGHQIRIKVGQGFAVRQGDSLAWYNP